MTQVANIIAFDKTKTVRHHDGSPSDHFIHYKEQAYSKKFCRSMTTYFDENPQLHIDGMAGFTVREKHLKDKEIRLDLSADWWDIKSPLGDIVETYKRLYPGVEYLHKWNLDRYCMLMKYEPGDAYWSEHCENDGYGDRIHRVFGWMIFLNSIEEGGGTLFTQQNFTATPRLGSLYMWPAGWTHIHRGVVAPNEHKYIITGWFNYYYD